MALTFYLDANEPVELPLGHDPDVLAASGEDAVRLYVATGDVSKLVVPEGSTLVTVRPLSVSEIREVGRRAGTSPALGTVVAGELDKVEEKAREKALRDQESKLSPEDAQALKAWRSNAERTADDPGAAVARKLSEAVVDFVMRARAEHLEGLAERERKALEDYQTWVYKRDEEMLKAGWIKVSNWSDVKQADLVKTLNTMVRPFQLQLQIRAELVSHIQRVSALPPLGKA